MAKKVSSKKDQDTVIDSNAAAKNSIPGDQIGIIAAAMFAEIISRISKRERKAMAPLILKGIAAGLRRWAAGTVNEGPNSTEMLGAEGLSLEEFTAFVRDLTGEEGAEMLTKVMGLFS